MSSIYPYGVDSKAQIPILIDTVTRIDALSINSHRDAIIKIETELGIIPKGNYSNVRTRIEALEDDTDSVRTDLAILEVDLNNLINDFNILKANYDALVIYLNSLNFLPTPTGVASTVIIEESSVYEQRVLTGSDIDGVTAAIYSEITAAPATNQNNYSPTGWTSATYVRLNPSASILITGFAARTAGTVLTLRNVSTFLIVLVSESSSSTATNRIATSSLIGEGHTVLFPGDTIHLTYDGTSSRWIATKVVNKIRDLGTKRSWKPYSGSVFDPPLNAGDLAAATSAGYSYPTPSSSDFVSSRFRVLFSSAAATNSGFSAIENTGTNDQYIIGNGTGYGGFAAYFSFGHPGFSATDDASSTFLAISQGFAPGVGNTFIVMANCLAFEIEPNDTSWHFQHNDGSGNASRVDLGSNFPRDSATAWYNGFIYSDPNYAGVSYVLWRADDLTLSPAIGDVTTDLPAAPGSVIINHTNKTSTTVHSIAFDHIYTWTPI